MPKMVKERGGHCMIACNNTIYIFGGFDNSDITNCERIAFGKE
jgi:hypothetical protein